ncbi:MAG: YigZ family protein [Candidatus Edwardsbacteria bacterium]|nr:YigZ family protein [Candidatus Edwardsbacteria bacterium]
MESLQINPYVVDRKSRYAVTAFPVASEADFAAGIRARLRDKKFRAADHNIAAYRIAGAGGKIAEYKNDGYNSPSKESGAGRLILEAMRRRNVVNWCVVATRWYGGVHLGPDRFRHVQNAALAIIERIPIH